jgi:hypothetical protein
MNETPMTAATASRVLALNQTATGVGYNIWAGDTKTEIRPEARGFTYSPWKATGLSPMVALALVREAACRGQDIMLWMCCACGESKKSHALGAFVSHGYCARHAPKKDCSARTKVFPPPTDR